MREESERAAGRRVCPVWIAYTFDNPIRRLFHEPRRMLREYVKPGARVLDFGCGLGFFSIAMARMVGEDGLVIAADLQQRMLDGLARRARRAGVADRIRLHRAEEDRIGLNTAVDFALACWVVHETPDVNEFFKELASILKPGGRLFVIEPRTHVSEEELAETIAAAAAAGLREVARPRVALSRAVVFARPGSSGGGSMRSSGDGARDGCYGREFAGPVSGQRLRLAAGS